MSKNCLYILKAFILRDFERIRVVHVDTMIARVLSVLYNKNGKVAFLY